MKFTILTACYNKSQWLMQSADSVLSQSYKNWEWIIVDDLSSDGSEKILEDFANADSRIVVKILNKRHYCSSSYGVALRMATGSYCGVLDADDVLKKNAIDTIVKLYHKYVDLGYIYSQHDVCNSRMEIIKKGVSSLPVDGKSFVEMAEYRRHCFSHWRTFKNGIVAPDILFPNGLKNCVDKYMGFVLEEHTIGGFYDRSLYKYRSYRGDNISTSVNKQGNNQKQRWFSMARKFKKHRLCNKIETYPVISVVL